MIVIAPETEALARVLAQRLGLSPEAAVRAAVERSAREAGVSPQVASGRSAASIEAGIEIIARRCASRPVYDDRTADVIIGYGEDGVPR